MRIRMRQHSSPPDRPRLRRRVLVGLAALGMLGGTTVVMSTQPASAVAGLQVAQFTPLRTSESRKIATVQCPGGTAGLGGDVEVFGSTQVRINAIVPTAVNVIFLLTAPDGASVGTWTFTARAFCAPASSLPGLEYRTATRRELSSVRNGPMASRVQARCSAGKQVIGQGASVEQDPQVNEPDPTRFLFLTDLGPGGQTSFPGTSVYGGGATRGFDGHWTVNAFAVCVNPGVAGLRIADGFAPGTSNADKLAQGSCGSSGVVHAPGFFLYEARDPSQMGQVYISKIKTGWPSSPGTIDVIARETPTGTTAIWDFGSTFICAN